MNNLSKRILRTILCTAISFFVVFILRFFTSTVFASESNLIPINEMNVDIASAFLNECLDRYNIYYNSNVELSENLPALFTQKFNEFAPSFQELTQTEYLNQLIVMPGAGSYVLIFPSNNTIGDKLNYLEVISYSSSQKAIGNTNCIRVDIDYSNSNINISLRDSTYSNYFGFTSITFNSDDTVINIINSLNKNPLVPLINYGVIFYNQNNKNYFIENPIYVIENSGGGDNPGDEGGGGGSEGGGDTGGTSVDLSNIENTLGDINTSIIQTGQETNQNLENINQNIEDLNNNITTVPDLSEKEEITGNDILENFNFEFTVDPYDNFWNTLLSELQSVLTTNNNRTITLEFRGKTYTISVDDFNLDKMPSILKNFLQLFSISVLTYFLLCWVKKSVDLISSGDMSEVLQMNEEEGIVDLF